MVNLMKRINIIILLTIFIGVYITTTVSFAQGDTVNNVKNNEKVNSEVNSEVNNEEVNSINNESSQIQNDDLNSLNEKENTISNEINQNDSFVNIEENDKNEENKENKENNETLVDDNLIVNDNDIVNEEKEINEVVNSNSKIELNGTTNVINDGNQAIGESSLNNEDYQIAYSSHVQNIGWQDYSYDGNISGTSGKALRIEALKIKKNSNISGDILYRVHVENIGWQDWRSENNIAGTTGKSLRIEAIEIRLDNSPDYTVLYRSHVENKGWTSWVPSGYMSGTVNKGLRMEAIEIKIINKSEAPKIKPTVSYNSHVENIGWQGIKNEGSTSGTIGKGLRLEALKVNLENIPFDGSLLYKSHVQNVGWQGWKNSSESITGTTDLGYRLEAIQMKIYNLDYSIVYRVHVQNIGWQNWKKDGETAGTTGMGLRIEAIQIKIMTKEQAAYYCVGATKAMVNIDSPTKVLTRDSSLKLAGWVLTDGNNYDIKVYIDNKEIETSFTRLERPDVLNAFKNEYSSADNPNPGFKTNIDISKIRDQELHTIDVRIVNTVDNSLLDNMTQKFRRTFGQLMGIDISEYQKSIDWAKVKNQVDFVILRVGYGSDDDYPSQKDSRFDEYMEACIRYDIPVEVYLFSYATTPERGVAEARHVIRALDKYRNRVKIYKVWYDIEPSSDSINTVLEQTMRNNTLENRKRLSSLCNNFKNTLKPYGYSAGIYASASIVKNYFEKDLFSGYDLWIAHYTGATQDNPSAKPSDLDQDEYLYIMWQYTSSGSVNGINTSVDMNLSYTDFTKDS